MPIKVIGLEINILAEPMLIYKVSEKVGLIGKVLKYEVESKHLTTTLSPLTQIRHINYQSNYHRYHGSKTHGSGGNVFDKANFVMKVGMDKVG